MEKTCSKCGDIKDETQFPWKKKETGKHHTYCLDCQREMSRRHYQDNTSYYLNKAKRNERAKVKANQEYILEYLKTHPCADCGESDPVVLEFDHRSDKHENISVLTRSGS